MYRKLYKKQKYFPVQNAIAQKTNENGQSALKNFPSMHFRESLDFILFFIFKIEAHTQTQKGGKWNNTTIVQPDSF